MNLRWIIEGFVVCCFFRRANIISIQSAQALSLSAVCKPEWQESNLNVLNKLFIDILMLYNRLLSANNFWGWFAIDCFKSITFERDSLRLSHDAFVHWCSKRQPLTTVFNMLVNATESIVKEEEQSFPQWPTESTTRSKTGSWYR